MTKDKLIGIDLGGTTTKLAFLNLDGSITYKWKIKTDKDNHGNNIIPNIIKSIKKEANLANYSHDNFIGVGMGTPGTINLKKGYVYGAYNLNWVQPHQVTKLIENGLQLPFTMDNDANVATLGEYRQGAGSNYNDIMLVTLGTGVGSGIIIDGHLIHGCNGDAGEIGHMTVQPGGYLCRCGKRGCLEQYASATGVTHIAKSMTKNITTEQSRLVHLERDHNTKVTSRMIFYLANTGDILANQVVNRVCSYLGLALANVADILNPDVILIGGGVSNAGNTLLTPTTEFFQENAFKPVKDSTQLKLATLGNNAGAVGAGSLALKFKE